MMVAGLASIEPRQASVLGYGAIGLAAVTVVSYMVLPQWRVYQSAENSLRLLQTSVADESSLDAQLEALSDDVGVLERTLNGDASNLPVRKMEAFVIGRLQTISWNSGIRLNGVQPRQGTPLSGFSELIFDVELEGGYFAFFDWLQAVGEELGFVVVKQFEMTSLNPAASIDEPRLKVNLTIASYRNQGP